MPTDKRALYQRMAATERPAPTLPHARGDACAELFLVLLFVLCVLFFVLAINTVLPPGW